MPSSPKRSLHSTRRKTSNQTVGRLAEAFVAQWLIQQGGEIIERRWHCRWGELDLVAYWQADAAGLHQATIAFVEVKARQDNNWDLDGLLAITPQKQQKLWKTAELFLSSYPHLANLPCRFDVALVHVHSVQSQRPKKHFESGEGELSNEFDFLEAIEMGKPVTIAGHSLSLRRYIPSAFDLT